MGHALMENRNSLILGVVTTRASGHAEARRTGACTGLPRRRCVPMRRSSPCRLRQLALILLSSIHSRDAKRAVGGLWPF